MVFLNGELDNLPVFPLADGFEDPSQFALNLFCSEDFASVLGCPDQMVFEVVEAMG